MSFILDALKKSESDRQRQHGPALFEVRVAPPRTRLPPWAIAIALLLAVNLGVVMWMLLRHQVHARAPAATIATMRDAPGAAGGPQPLAAASSEPLLVHARVPRAARPTQMPRTTRRPRNRPPPVSATTCGGARPRGCRSTRT